MWKSKVRAEQAGVRREQPTQKREHACVLPSVCISACVVCLGVNCTVWAAWPITLTVLCCHPDGHGWHCLAVDRFVGLWNALGWWLCVCAG